MKLIVKFLLSFILVIVIIFTLSILVNSNPLDQTPKMPIESIAGLYANNDLPEITPILINPSTESESESANEDDIEPLSDTYWIDVSIDEQKIYLYDGSKLIIDGEIVSGLKDKCDTPKGQFKIYNMEKEKILTGNNFDGSTYESYVDYWMPFYGNYGIHDAQWREYFSGDIYTYNGSHGCINTEYDVMEILFYYSDIGTIVNIH